MDNNFNNQELQLFVQAMKQRYGYDFNQYQAKSLQRRVEALVKQQKCRYISELIPRIYHQENFLELAISQISVGFTEFFRDPDVYKTLSEKVLPLLASYPSIKVWSAGCSTGEEAYSLAILFKEAGLLKKTTIYATDLNKQAIEYCKKGIYTHQSAKQDCTNYHQAGGQGSFTDYFACRYQHIKLNNAIIQAVTFNTHNLVQDGVFCEVQLVVCRNVLIYFKPELQDKVFSLFINALARNCFLLLGLKDCLYADVLKHSFDPVDEKIRLYRKK